MSALFRTIGDDLSRFFLKEGLSAAEIAEISLIAQYKGYAPGEVIIAEGEVNVCLYFLVEGTVSIVRAGERIATVSKAGDVLGEMSLITQNEASASNIADGLTVLLVLEITKLNQLTLPLQVTLVNALNRLFSQILSVKLMATNEKARLFEITNRELQVAKKALESASADKIDELSSNQRLAFKKVDTVLRDEIMPIRDELVRFESNLGEDGKKEIAVVLSRLQRVVTDLDPLLKNFEEDGGLRDKRVLLVEDDIDEQINAKMSLGGTGVDFTVLSDMESAKKAVQEKRFDIICVNGNFVELIAFARGLHPETKYVFVTSDTIAEHFQTLKKFPELSTILARHPKDRTFTVRNISTTIRKLSGRDIFGVEKYLSWGTDVATHTVTGSAQRGELLSKLEDYLDSIGIRGPLKRKSSRVAEELLMNAIYDAPTDSAGKSIYNHHDRSVPLELKPREFATFRYACDGTFLAISVVDRFGALSRSTILAYLERCFQGQLADAADKGGGGNGLFQIIQSSSLTAFNVRPGSQTEVIALLNINIQMEKMSTHPSFHYFETTS
jgi:CRP-like cAMP-binding protein